MEREIVVLGGGIVGTCCALHLLKRGFKVTLVDRCATVRETSYGNAGVIASNSLLPLNNAGLWKHLLSFLTNRQPALRYRIGYLVRNCRWLVQYLANATEQHDRHAIDALKLLIKPALEEHCALLREAGMLDHLRMTGWLKLYRSDESYALGSYERHCLEEAGVKMAILDRSEIQALEPDLHPIFPRGLWFQDSASVDDPGAVTQSYRQLFSRGGGQVVIDEVRQVQRNAEGYLLNGCAAPIEAARLVIAQGPWSNDLLSGLNLRFPLAFERGYHRHFLAQGNKRLQRPFFDIDGGYVMTPMALGYRITTGTELADRDAPATPDQLQQVIPSARQAFPLGPPTETPVWYGSRPSLPDSLPVIGPVPGHPGLWLAFGHNRIGFTTGPTTGKLLAEMIDNQKNLRDLAAFLPERFIADS